MIKHFALPAYINDNSDFNLIAIVEEHIQTLRVQSSANNILRIFKDFPNLESFSFRCNQESNDEGGSYLYISLSDYKLINDSEPDDDFESNLDDAVVNLTDEHCEQFFYHLNKVKISTNNAQEVIAKAMGKDDYNKWQEAKIIDENEALEKVMKPLETTENTLKI